MTTNNTGRVAGERVVDLGEALQGVTLHPTRHGMTRFEGTVGAPVVRALMRLEAELLIADANAESGDGISSRTYDQRRADALMLLFERLQESLPSSGMPSASTALGH